MSKVGTAFEEPEGEDEAPKKFVPVWQQDVRDEEGRRRFHGAFTGGFSAGYYNTVGSKEGWTPAMFTSSRTQRAERVVSAPQQFMDSEDYEGAGVGGRALSSRKEYDVFASRAPSSIAASIQAGEGAAAHSSALASMLAAPRDSVGSKLLKLMGWREGRRIGPRKTPLAPPPVVSAPPSASAPPARKVYGVSLIDDIRQEQEDEQDEERCVERMKEEAPVQVLSFKQKSDTFGIGFDPHSAAPELCELAMRREAEKEAQGKTQRPVLAMAAALQTGKSVHVPQRFGLGALEKGEGAWSAEAYDNAEIAYDREINDAVDDDPHHQIRKQPSASQRAVDQLLPDSAMVTPREAQKGRDGRAPLRRFRLAEKVSLPVKSFNTPPLPASYVPHHTIAKPRTEATRSTNASARATLLGETALPDQAAPPPSVRGGLLSAADRDRLLAQATGGGGGGSDAKRAAEMARIGGVMASRFVTAGSSFSSTATVTADGKTGRVESAAEAAARSGMYGKFTRAEEPWRPEKLLCKRWNIRDPWHGRDDAPKTDKEKQAAALAALISQAESSAAAQQAQASSMDLAANSSAAMEVEEAERSGEAAAPAAEPARASIDLFKAIFADDDDDAPLLPPPLPTAKPAAPPSIAPVAAAPSSAAMPAIAATQQAASTVAGAVSQGGAPPHTSTTKRPRASDFM